MWSVVESQQSHLNVQQSPVPSAPESPSTLQHHCYKNYTLLKLLLFTPAQPENLFLPFPCLSHLYGNPDRRRVMSVNPSSPTRKDLQSIVFSSNWIPWPVHIESQCELSSTKQTPEGCTLSP